MTENNEKSDKVYMKCLQSFRILLVLTMILFMKCECPIQCCPEQLNTELEFEFKILTSINNGRCITSCRNITPYLVFKGDRISLSSNSDGCQWLNKSLPKYADSLLTLKIEVNDTNLILIDTLFLDMGSKHTITISVNEQGDLTDMVLVKTFFINCDNTVDTIFVYDKESVCNECNN